MNEALFAGLDTREPKEDIHVGDRLRIRNWEDMVEEALLSGLDVREPFGFVPAMKHFCGKVIIVTEIKPGGWIYFDGDEGWCFNRFMFEPYIEPAEMASELNLDTLLG